MKKHIIVLIGLAVTITACNDDPAPMPQVRGEVILATPLSRQKTTYQKFSSHCPGNYDTETDTIILEVVLEDGIKYFDEYGTPGSMSSEVRNHNTRMRVEPEFGVVRIFNRSESYLFGPLPTDEILVDSSYSEELWQGGCEILTISDSTVFAGNEPGLINTFRIDTILTLDQKFMMAGPEPTISIKKYVVYDHRHLHVSFDGISDPGAGGRMIGWVRVEP